MTRKHFAASLTVGLCALSAKAGTFTSAPFNGDATVGIAPDSAFTHAINVGDTGNLTVNGAVFTGSGQAVPNPTTNDYSTSGLTATTSNNPTVTGDSKNLLTRFYYDGNPEVVTLKNLRVGQSYVTTFYNSDWGPVGGRVQTITASDGVGASTSFDQNFTNTGDINGGAGNGNLLRYTFSATSPTQTFTFTPSGGGTFHQYAFSNQLVGYKALLTDNYYAPSNPDTTEINFNLPARQGGSLVTGPGGANITYSKTRNNNSQVGNPTGGIDGGNYLLSASGSVAALDHNFNGAESAGGLLVAFDLAPNVAAATPDNWASINLGAGETDKGAYVADSVSHFGILFRGAGTLQAFDAGTVVTPVVEPVWTATAQTTQLHHIELLITDPTDLNPFDGVGETDIAVYADGVNVYNFTKSGGGYAQNFINFDGSSVAGFDNLLIAQAVPEPTIAGAIVLGGMTLLARRRRQI